MSSATRTTYDQIHRLMAASRHDEALSLAQVLACNPASQQGGWAFAAYVAAVKGDAALAAESLSRLPEAIELQDAEAAFAAGSAWFKLGGLTKAKPYLALAAEKQPDDGLVRARLGAVLLGMGLSEQALPHLARAAGLIPASGGAGLNHARALHALGRHEEALKELARCQGLPDMDAGSGSLLQAQVLAASGHSAEAEAQLRALGDVKATLALANLLAGQDRHDEADLALSEAVERFPDETALYETGAELAQARGRFGQAAHLLRLALAKQPESPVLLARLAMLVNDRLEWQDAQPLLDKALALTDGQAGPERAQVLAVKGHILSRSDAPAGAEAVFREALALFPQCVPALAGLGHWLLEVGRVEEAVATFEQLRQVAPLMGWSHLIQARQMPDDPRVLDTIEQAARRPSLEGPTRSHLLFNLAAAWERGKDYGRAFSLAREANESAKKHLGYQPEEHRRRVEREMGRFSREFMASRQGFGSDSRLPVFVLGMPRSGTTLVEQILGGHSQVHGAGELSQIPLLIQKFLAWEMKLGSRLGYPECVEDYSPQVMRGYADKLLKELQTYAPEAKRVVDKLPHNFEHVGLIKLLFPRAAIIHCRREARDIAISNYFTDYGAKFGGMGFAYDLDWIGEQLVDHDRLMKHWHQVFPGQILEVVYEDLVEDTEAWARKMIDYLGLEWEPGVLNFQDLDRPVKTASVWQVRQPVYKTSKAKWRRYEKFLEPLEQALSVVPPLPAALPLSALPPGAFHQAMACLGKNQPMEAERIFHALLTEYPDHAAARHFLGAALFQQGRLAEAKAAMEKSIELLGVHAQWKENLAAVEDALGNTEAARAWREKARPAK